jgi:hypothetical protein
LTSLPLKFTTTPRASHVVASNRLLDDDTAAWTCHHLLGVDHRLELSFGQAIVATLPGTLVRVVVVFSAGLSLVVRLALDAVDFQADGAVEIGGAVFEHHPAWAVGGLAVEGVLRGGFSALQRPGEVFW